MEDLSLHILDIVENATAAGASLIEIGIKEDPDKDRLELTIRDNGRGMDAETVQRVLDPFYTTRTTRRVGLGLSLLKQSAREADGDLEVHSEPGRGTEVTATFRVSHIDRRPIGDMGSTLITLILGSPDLEFRYEAHLGGETTTVDTRELRADLEGISITDPAVLDLMRRTINGDTTQ